MQSAKIGVYTRSFHSYPKVWNLGHPSVKEIFEDEVEVQEKIDGSQLSFGKDHDGTIHIRSKNREFPINGPDSLFERAAEQIAKRADKLPVGYTFRGEYLNKPKHNCLVYDRTPIDNIVIFDVTSDLHQYLEPSTVARMAEELVFEHVKSTTMKISSIDDVKELMELPSMLGGKREGLVFKNYKRSLS